MGSLLLSTLRSHKSALSVKVFELPLSFTCKAFRNSAAFGVINNSLQILRGVVILGLISLNL